jgi:hypothetical protein
VVISLTSGDEGGVLLEAEFLDVIGTKFLKGQYHKIFGFSFFHESPSPKSLAITLGSFRICSKIRGDFLLSAVGVSCLLLLGVGCRM